MSARHSPAPYTYRADRTIADATGTPLARCYADRNEDATGPLFAAAPDLLEALKFYVAVFGNTAAMVTRESAQEAYDMATAAIAKARGLS